MIWKTLFLLLAISSSLGLSAVWAQHIAPARQDLIINEIMYDPPVGYSEFVELYNRSDQPLDLALLQVSDNRHQPVPITDQTNLALAPNHYAVLVRDASAFAAQFPEVPFLEVARWPALNNGGDAVVLWLQDIVIDSVAYTNRWGGVDVALERRDPEAASQNAMNWADAIDPSGGTPGRQNSRYDPDRSSPTVVFTEQIHDNTLMVYFDESLDPQSVIPDAFLLDDTTHPLSVEPSGAQVRLTFGTPIVSLTLTILEIQDLVGNRTVATTTPIARLPQPGDVIINEIMYDPLADRFDNRPDQPEYVEFFNTRPYPITLHHTFTTRKPDESGDADT